MPTTLSTLTLNIVVNAMAHQLLQMAVSLTVVILATRSATPTPAYHGRLDVAKVSNNVSANTMPSTSTNSVGKAAALKVGFA